MANEISIWNKMLSTVLQMPGVKVNRDKYLATTLANYNFSKEDIQKAIKTCPQMVVDKKMLIQMSNPIIGSHLKKVSAISFVSGIPGGVALTATIPADMAQYYFHALVLSQKLAYLYGMPALYDEKGELTDEAVNLMTVFIGVMSGVGIANQTMKKMSQAFAEQIVKRLPQYPLTKYVIYQVVKQIAKWIGVRLTKDTFAKGVSKVVPFVGGVVSGSVTYCTFKKEAKRIKKQLQENMDLYRAAYEKIEKQIDDESVEYADFEESQ